MVYWSLLWYTGVYYGVLEFTIVYWSLLWYTGGYNGVLWYTIVYVYIHVCS